LTQTLPDTTTAFGTILVVEDEGLIALDLQRRLQALGYTVPTTCATAEEAFTAASSHVPDLILMDIRLRGERDGIDAAEQIRTKLDIPVVFLTAHADMATLDRAKAASPFGYIVKPFGSTDLRANIEIARYRHKAEQIVRRNEAWLAAALGSLNEAVIVATPDCLIETMNPLAERLTGWPLERARGRSVDEIFVVVDAQTNRPVTHPALAVLAHESGSGSVQAEYRLFGRGGGSALIKAVVSSTCSEDGLAVLVFAFRDIAAERELERLARQSQRMETVSSMAGALAHDLNNVLTVVLGYADLLQSKPESRCPEVEQIRLAGVMGARLAKDLLRASRTDVVRSEVLDWNELIGSSEKMLARILSPRSTIRLALCPEALYIRSDQTQLRQILVNIATNARDAMPKGGELLISTRLHDSGMIETIARDTGMGMSPRTVDHIFEPFFTLKGDRGTGLGMSIIHSIVSQWGGTISVESLLGAGTSFIIRLPRAEPSERELESAPSSVDNALDSSPGGPPATVMLVEDNAAIRDLLREELTNAGFSVITANDGEAGFAMLRLQKKSVDLLITDVMMPRMTGPELAKHCVEACPGARVLFLSGYSELTLADNDLLRTGKAEFLGKPLLPADLISRARAMLLQ
jgi:two-component system cell cycle sensor histidine kinase/response regulator CckA